MTDQVIRQVVAGEARKGKFLVEFAAWSLVVVSDIDSIGRWHQPAEPIEMVVEERRARRNHGHYPSMERAVLQLLKKAEPVMQGQLVQAIEEQEESRSLVDRSFQKSPDTFFPVRNVANLRDFAQVAGDQVDDAIAGWVDAAESGGRGEHNDWQSVQPELKPIDRGPRFTGTVATDQRANGAFMGAFEPSVQTIDQSRASNVSSALFPTSHILLELGLSSWSEFPYLTDASVTCLA